jgi:hypothetical protein
MGMKPPRTLGWLARGEMKVVVWNFLKEETQIGAYPKNVPKFQIYGKNSIKNMLWN